MKMAISSCDHTDFIVVYDVSSGNIKCPVCTIQQELEDANSRIEELEIGEE